MEETLKNKLEKHFIDAISKNKTQGAITDRDTIINFLKGITGDYLGRKYQDHLDVDDREMEFCHDRVQQIFPSWEPSKYAHTYIILTPEVVEEAKKSEAILNNLKMAKIRFEKFLGIGDYEDINKQREWCKNRNHNLLRITRIIRCLRLFGLKDDAFDFYEKVSEVADSFGISVITFEYWEKAYYDDVWASLQN